MPLHFVDASVQCIRNEPKQSLSDSIQALTESFLGMREESQRAARVSQQRQEGIFKALCQRHATDISGILEHTDKITTESRAIMEKYVQDALRIESSSFEERSKHHEATIKAHVEHFEASMENESVYRDTLHTEHQLKIDGKLQESEARISEKQDKQCKDIMEAQEEQSAIVKEQIEKTNAQVQDVFGKVHHIEANLKEVIVETVWDMIQQHRATRLENGRSIIQLIDTQESALEEDAMKEQETEEMEGDDRPDWGGASEENKPRERTPLPRPRQRLRSLTRVRGRSNSKKIRRHQYDADVRKRVGDDRRYEPRRERPRRQRR